GGIPQSSPPIVDNVTSDRANGSITPQEQTEVVKPQPATPPKGRLNNVKRHQNHKESGVHWKPSHSAFKPHKEVNETINLFEKVPVPKIIKTETKSALSQAVSGAQPIENPISTQTPEDTELTDEQRQQISQFDNILKERTKFDETFIGTSQTTSDISHEYNL
ncbi:hypothetical protein DID76_03960, partial [Candidatus Marinamargulisbacteria bacterium SCGC AG-414-C22]